MSFYDVLKTENNFSHVKVKIFSETSQNLKKNLRVRFGNVKSTYKKYFFQIFVAFLHYSNFSFINKTPITPIKKPET